MTKRIDELTGKKKLSKIIGMYHQKVVDSWTNHDGDYPKNVAKYGRSLALHKVRSSDDQESVRKAVKFYNPHILQKEGTEMHDQIKAMLQSLEDGNAANAKDLFASVMSVKVADKIDALAPIVSLSMFEGKEGADDD